MPRIIAALIRHGDYHQLQDTPSAWQPFALNSDGKNHAITAAVDIYNALCNQQWQLEQDCDSSQLLRAWQTANIIVEHLKKQDSINSTINSTINSVIKICSYDQLAERGVGSVANLTITQIEDIVNNDPRYDALPKNWKSNSHYCLPFQGAESLLDSGERVAKHIKTAMLNLRKKLNSQNKVSTKVKTSDTLKLFVGHGAAFRHAACHLGILEFDQIAQLSMYHGQPVYIELLEDNSWTHILGNWKVRGKTSHYND